MNEITPQLWISDISDVREGDKSKFNRIITVCQDSVEDNVGCAYNHYNMADGPFCDYGGDYSYELFHEAAITLLGALEYGETVLIHCHAGRSRSVSVTIAALAVFNDWSYDEAYNHVERKRPQIHPDGLLVKHAKRFIEKAS